MFVFIYYCCLGGSLEEITDKKIRPLFGLMSAGFKFFNRCVFIFKHCRGAYLKNFFVLQNNKHYMFSFSLGVKNQKEAESLWEQFFQWVWNILQYFIVVGRGIQWSNIQHNKLFNWPLYQAILKIL